MKDIQLPSDKSIGILFSIVFALVSVWFAWRGTLPWQWFAIPAGMFLITAYSVPRILRPLNIAWMALGALLNKIVSPLMLGVIYFLIITPVALFFKIIGRDELKRNFDSNLNTYWVPRTPPGPDAPGSFTNQF
ncbi:MAG TPA: SxtJ family membrane protein [Hydrogenophaga sp.]|uniref:SxtJ family membrane protein n=1 Tax=Hydrogenophaga sp. TaxID=1904254 RepID=UPI002B9731EB|nr:SxtJ family membrane protein [Hydrogenophaga sp.]HMN91998.1 SxtJ family membrane protein [Hydrogenophaga sp.]HMP08800.1 SxtJ family membrane protein [Hydrogenophaga sp.]